MEENSWPYYMLACGIIFAAVLALALLYSGWSGPTSLYKSETVTVIDRPNKIHRTYDNARVVQGIGTKSEIVTESGQRIMLSNSAEVIKK